jgi:hypothetical protein
MGSGMRSLLCRFWLLAPLLLLFAQGCGGLRAEEGTLAAATTSYLPAEASGSERSAVEEDATVESDDDDDDSKRDGDVGSERSELDQAPSTAAPVPALLLRWRHRRVDGGLSALQFRRVALPLRGPPSAGDGER